MTVGEGVTGEEYACAACGAINPIPSTPPDTGLMLAPESERALWQQKRRRATALLALCILFLLAVLGWLLLHPSASRSPARQVKNAVFGRRVTEAVEQAAQAGREGSGNSQGQGQGGQGARGQGQGKGQGQSGGGAQSGDEAGASQAQGESGGSGAGNRGRGLGSRRPGEASNSPANPQLPDQASSGLAASPERSIGWLDRFFGGQHTDGPIQAGEGGTGSGQPGSGNTNITTASPTNEPVASEITQAQPSPPRPLTDQPPPAPPRDTNRAAPPSNATLNDNLEQLLRQHRAGTGEVRISLMWANRNDIDLHVLEPGGEEINYNHRRSRSGGLLDIDMNASPPLRTPAVENVFWPTRAAPIGAYKVYVNHYRKHDVVDETAFTVRVLVRGRTTDFRGSIRFGQPKQLVHQFTLAPVN